MSQDPRGKRLSREQREAIEKDLRAAKKSMRSISVDHGCSISTVSKLAAELGIPSRRVSKSKPIPQQPDYSYDKGRRIAVLDKMLASIEDQISSGGLSSKQLFDLARSARELTTSRRGEDQLPDALDVESGAARGKAGEVTTPADLVKLDRRGAPKNFPLYFAVADFQGAEANGDEEAKQAARQRVVEGCVEAGFSADEVNIEDLVHQTDADYFEEEARKLSAGEARGEVEKEYNGEGLA